jgi:hypothetical protein
MQGHIELFERFGRNRNNDVSTSLQDNFVRGDSDEKYIRVVY